MIDSIRRRSEFQLLRDAGRYRRSGPLGLRCVSPERVPEVSDSSVNVAYAIGRPVGGAVVRNRLRRQLRSILSDLDKDGRMNPGLYLVVASPDATSLHFSELRVHVERLIGPTS